MRDRQMQMVSLQRQTMKYSNSILRKHTVGQCD